MKLNHLVVLGSGLIGGSLAMAARQRSVAATVSVVNRSMASSQSAVEQGAADCAYTYDQLTKVLKQLSAGDLVVVAVPVNSYQSVFERIGGDLPEGVLLTDVGSTKVRVIEAARSQWCDGPETKDKGLEFFVPGHPIAGSEKSGVDAADPKLYENRKTILTPLASNPEQAVNLVADFWRAIGAEVDQMTPEHHDDILAATSHLPHLLAYGLVDSLYTLDQKTEVFRYAAGGFRDFTRIAQSDPVMWRDIFLANKRALAKQLENFEEHIADLRKAIDSEDIESVQAILERAQAARKLYMETNKNADQSE